MKMISGFFYLTGFALLGASTLVCAMNPELIPATFNVDSDAWLESMISLYALPLFSFLFMGLGHIFSPKVSVNPFN